MLRLRLLLKAFAADRSGATAIEYALIGSMISIVIVGTLVSMNGSLTGIYTIIQSKIVPALQGTASSSGG